MSPLNKITALLQADYGRGDPMDAPLPPNRPTLRDGGALLEALRPLLFPALSDPGGLSGRVARAQGLLERLLQPLLPPEECPGISLALLQDIPSIRASLQQDLQAFLAGDPAAVDGAEILTAYPGFYAIWVYRLAHALHRLGAPVLPRLLAEVAHSRTGIDIHPGASIGEAFFLDHGTGVVIGETAVIGRGGKIYQGVTLGARSTRGGQGLKGKKRHPTIEDGVTIYANASILGGDTVIGRGATIGGNAFVTASVPAGATVTGNWPDP